MDDTLRMDSKDKPRGCDLFNLPDGYKMMGVAGE